MLGSLPSNTAFVSVDFVEQDLGSALLEATYDPGQRTFFIWEGVTNYLTPDAVDTTLRWIATHSPPASRLSFTYVDRGLLDGSKSFPGSERWIEAVQRAGEPFTFGLDPDELKGYLAEGGMRLRRDTSTAEALTHFPPRAAEAPPPAFYRVALAEINDETETSEARRGEERAVRA